MGRREASKKKNPHARMRCGFEFAAIVWLSGLLLAQQVGQEHEGGDGEQ